MLWLAIFTGKIAGQRFVDGLVDHEDIRFASFRFCDGDGVANLFAHEVMDSEAQEVACSDAIVDAKVKRSKSLGFGAKICLRLAM